MHASPRSVWVLLPGVALLSLGTGDDARGGEGCGGGQGLSGPRNQPLTRLGLDGGAAEDAPR